MMGKTLSNRILVVDDEPDVRTILTRHLTGPACECVSSPEAADALEKLARNPFSLVISDINMPGMSGMKLLERIRGSDPDVSVIMITGMADLSTAVDAIRLGACDYITKPFDLEAVRRSVRRALERHRLMEENTCYRRELEQMVQKRTIELKRTLSELEESYRITLEALATALDAREHETKAHSQRVQEYAAELAGSLGLAGEELLEIRRGALLHDVGKIGVPDSILMKPGALTPEEWVEMKKHPQIGYEILQSIDFLAPAAEIVLAHQESWNGAGYPNGLRGAEIPLGARIFAVVDTLDAMTSDRPYRKALPFETAWKEIRRCRGIQFDPDVAGAFLDIDMSRWLEIRDAVNRKHRNRESCVIL